MEPSKRRQYQVVPGLQASSHQGALTQDSKRKNDIESKPNEEHSFENHEKEIPRD